MPRQDKSRYRVLCRLGSRFSIFPRQLRWDVVQNGAVNQPNQREPRLPAHTQQQRERSRNEGQAWRLPSGPSPFRSSGGQADFPFIRALPENHKEASMGAILSKSSSFVPFSLLALSYIISDTFFYIGASALAAPR